VEQWLPLSMREGGALPVEEPYFELEPHMWGPLNEWTDARIESYGAGYNRDLRESRLRLIATRLRWRSDVSGAEIARSARDDPRRYRDYIDALLQWWDEPDGFLGSAEMLSGVLAIAGSAWTVGPDGKSLQLRVDETAQQQVSDALSPGDLAADALSDAWGAAFGREPNASDAWDHAIKAVEHIYVPLVVANKAKNGHAGLGDVIGQLGQNPAGWETTITVDPADPSEGVAVVRNMMRALWGNPDRHGGSPTWWPPDQAEAEVLVHLAVTLVQWGRQGVLRKVPRP